MFKEITVFSIASPAQFDSPALERALAAAEYVPATATEERSVGWIPPRGEAHGPLLEQIDGHWLSTLRIEAKSFTRDALRKMVDQQSACFENDNGRLPGRKERREMAENARCALIAKAPGRIHDVPVWIDTAARRVVVGSVSKAKVDPVVTALVRAVDGLRLQERGDCAKNVATMKHWLMLGDAHAMPDGMQLGQECLLRAPGAGRSMARFSNQTLSCEEVRQNVRAGKDPVALALTWGKRLELVLMASGRLRKIKLSSREPNSLCRERDDFDSVFSIFVAEMGAVLQQLDREIGATAQSLSDAEGESAMFIHGIARLWEPRSQAVVQVPGQSYAAA